MADYSVYRYPAPAASFVVRLVRSGDQVQGFIRQVQEEDDPKAYYPSEQMPAAEASVYVLGVCHAMAVKGAIILPDLSLVAHLIPSLDAIDGISMRLAVAR